MLDFSLNYISEWSNQHLISGSLSESKDHLASAITEKKSFVFLYSYPHISVQFVSKQDMSLSVYVHSSPSSLTLNLSRADNLSFKSTCILLDWSNPSAFNRTQQQLVSNCLKPWRSKFDEPLSFSQRIKICEECMHLLGLRFQKYSNWNEVVY